MILHNTENYPFTPEVLEIDGNRYAYLDEGPKDKPVVLMLHGNPSWSYLYRNLILALRDDFRCIAPDHIGCGNSDKPQEYGYHLENHVANVERLIEHLKLETFSLIVHDWGGAIGAGVSIRHPDKVKSYTAMNTAAFLSSRIPARINACRIPLLGELMVRGFNAFAGAATSMAVAKKMPADIARDFVAPYHNWATRIATHRFVTDIPMAPGEHSYDLMKEIDETFATSTMPKQIIWGGRDFCFNDSFYDTWCQRFPEAPRHYFSDAGHYLLEDAGDKIYPLIKTFLSELTASHE